MRPPRTSTLKRSAVLIAATGMAVSGVITGTGSAQAATGPGGATNIRGIDRGDTDSMVDRFCNQKGGIGGLGGAYNVRTGEFKTKDEYLDTVAKLWYPSYDWEIFEGKCEYPEAATWSTKGAQVRTSPWIGNHGSKDDKETFVSSYTTKTYAKKSVGGSISASLAKGIFSVSGGGSISYEWGWEKSSTYERRSEKTIPPCTQIATTWTPYQRVVRVNPIIKIDKYQWDKGNGRKTAHTWRNRSNSYKKIYSYGYYIDGTSDKLLSNGQADGREDKWEQKLDRKSCA